MVKQQPRRPSEQPLIIEYTNLLHQYRDVNAAEVQRFLKQHADDPVFVRRAAVLNKVFKLKPELNGPDIDQAIEREENKGMEGKR